jgi:hypothetical protein
MSDSKERILEQVFEDEFYKNISSKVSVEEKKSLDVTIDSFVSGFASPILDVFDAILQDPDALEELKKQLRNNNLQF